MITLASTSRMLQALKTARNVTFSAYLMHPGPVERALERAALRGARVQVRLEGRMYRPTSAMLAANRKAVADLRAAGVDARLVHRTQSDGPAMHLKAAVCDGEAFLDGCDWNAGDTVIRDTTVSDVNAMRTAALCEGSGGTGALSLNKADALACEARTIEHFRGAHVDVETETLGVSRISAELRRLAKAGVHCRLLVSAQGLKESVATSKQSASLKRDGVDVRVIDANEKLAVAGARAWVGSVDATSPHYNSDQLDWGLSTKDRHLVHALETRFNTRWRTAKPYLSS